MNNNIKLMPGEAEDMGRIAMQIFDKYGPKSNEKVTAREMFILGFLHGRQYTLEDIGILDIDNHDDDKIYDFLQKRL